MSLQPMTQGNTAKAYGFSIRRSLSDLSIPHKLSLIIGLFSIVVVALLTLSYGGMEILSGSRAYVSGEGFWSKAEKEAVYHLTRYALFQEESDYHQYLEHISIPLGDHQARVEMGKPDMAYALVVQGFVQGRNHSADIQTMVFMARKLYRFPYMKQALTIWGQADDALKDLPPVAEALHQEISAGHSSPSRIKELLTQVHEIDARLTPLEDDFSYTLGEGARWLKTVLLAAMIMATLVFLAVTLAAAFWISKHLCEEIDHLRDGASRIASGDYAISLKVESNDEIGDLARTFQRMAEQRHEAERIKDEFFANVSHELRTPLTLILSPLESLLSQTQDPAMVTSLQTMHNNTIRLLQLVNGLLDFSKLEAKKVEVQRVPLRIVDVTRTLYDDFLPTMRVKNVQASFEATVPQAAVMMDRYLYERIFFNLLSNAIKFTPSGGRIAVRLTGSAGRLILAISDTGIGIPQDQQARIFHRFRQVEGSSTRRFEGTGLGLSLAQEFAKLLGGSIDVESAPRKGSTFTLTCQALPAAVPKEKTPTLEETTLRVQQYPVASAPAVAPSASGDAALPKVLVAEDNVELSVYIHTLLAPFCQVTLVRDGNEALKAVAAWSPDLILTDVMMPDRDGLSLCQEVKSNPATAPIPVVMLTALTHREALLEGWKAGANEYLFKPFHPQELVTRVRSLLHARQTQQASDEKIRHLHENLRRHALDLVFANKELEAFSYSVSHDLRAPLRAIDGFSQQLLLHSEAVLDERGKSDLHRIRAATERMTQLINDLLELSHLSRSELHRQPVDLSAQILDILEKLKAADPSRRVDVSVAPEILAEGDTHLVHIALENLVQNAWKFTARQAQPKVEFGQSEHEGKKAFYVRDNGAGFNMAYAGKLFKPFQRLHDASEYPGTGIGLALVQRIIQRHGGKIWMESEENHGATFYFTLS